MDPKINLRMIRNRAKALYHNCHSSACYKRSDADSTDDEKEQLALLREAQAYEVTAQWIKGLIDII